MVYRLDRSKSGSLRLKEELTGCAVRLQTSDTLLTETFWNHYHQDRKRLPARSLTLAAEPTSRSRPTDIGARDSRLQASLPLQETSTLTALAARSTPVNAPSRVQDLPRPNKATPNAHETFPLSAAEVFDGISKIKKNQSTGGKRYAVFEEWLNVEKIGIRDGVRLLRFIEATLDANNARPSHVYKRGDLIRWYREMSNGDMIGSWQ
jgi:hypothetical protein